MGTRVCEKLDNQLPLPLNVRRIAVMASNKRRRSLKDANSPSSKFAAVQSTPVMFISLPSPRIPPTIFRRRSPLTPPTVTPPAVSIFDSPLAQPERRMPSQRATALLAKVAVVSSTPQHSAPSSPRICPESPSEYNIHFPFSSSNRYLPESPDGGYVSFPVFEEFSDSRSDDERGRSSSPGGH